MDLSPPESPRMFPFLGEGFYLLKKSLQSGPKKTPKGHKLGFYGPSGIFGVVPEDSVEKGVF